MESYTPVQVAKAIMLYMYNVRRGVIIDDLFPGIHPSYVAEWLERLEDGFGPFFVYLDNDHREAFVANALEVYGDEVRR